MEIDRLEEFETKVAQVRTLLAGEEVDGILIGDQHGFAWITCGGDNHVSLGGPTGSASVLVTEDRAYLICNNVERLRLTEEEVAGLPLEVCPFNWHDGSDRQVIRDLMPGGQLGSDVPRPDAKDVSKTLIPLRYQLLEPEIERLKWLGEKAEAAVREVAFQLEVGESEFELAGRLARACYARKMLPLLTLVAVDERIERVRHPIPTDRELERTAMLVLCARRWGLYANLTRLVCFEMMDDDLRQRHDAVTYIDATLILSSRVGTPYSELFDQAVRTYQDRGYPDEWRGLHLGGATGYAGRYFKASPGCREVVQEGQAIAWNPSIAGTKSEDTLVVGRDEITIVTEARDWPKVQHQIGEIVVPRPDILVR